MVVSCAKSPATAVASSSFRGVHSAPLGIGSLGVGELSSAKRECSSKAGDQNRTSRPPQHQPRKAGRSLGVPKNSSHAYVKKIEKGHSWSIGTIRTSNFDTGPHVVWRETMADPCSGRTDSGLPATESACTWQICKTASEVTGHGEGGWGEDHLGGGVDPTNCDPHRFTAEG